jgi:hypothetical protein
MEVHSSSMHYELQYYIVMSLEEIICTLHLILFE